MDFEAFGEKAETRKTFHFSFLKSCKIHFILIDFTANASTKGISTERFFPLAGMFSVKFESPIYHKSC
jgi:hypothetical protein